METMGRGTGCLRDMVGAWTGLQIGQERLKEMGGSESRACYWSRLQSSRKMEAYSQDLLFS